MNSKLYHSPTTSMVKLRSEGAMLADSTQVTCGFENVNTDLPDISVVQNFEADGFAVTSW